MKKESKNLTFPKFKKKIKAFLLGEEGKISKESLLKSGLTLSSIGMATSPVLASDIITTQNSLSLGYDSGSATATHVSHSNHASHGSHASHSNHGNHGSHGSHASHSNHGNHGSHGSHASHSNHGSHASHSNGGDPEPPPDNCDPSDCDGGCHSSGPTTVCSPPLVNVGCGDGDCPLECREVPDPCNHSNHASHGSHCSNKMCW